MQQDRRDRIDPGEKEWEDFRSVFAASRLFAFLIEELADIAPEYGADLQRRLNEAIAAGEGLSAEDPSADGPALLPSFGNGSPAMLDLSEAELLERQLFPEREPHDPRDFQQTTRGLALGALHSALEGYASSVGATRPRTPLPKAIAAFLARSNPLSGDLADALTELDETRHIIVHNGAIVDQRYVDNVKYNKLITGEPRIITDNDLARYFRTVWSVAETLHEHRGAAG